MSTCYSFYKHTKRGCLVGIVFFLCCHCRRWCCLIKIYLLVQMESSGKREDNIKHHPFCHYTHKNSNENVFFLFILVTSSMRVDVDVPRKKSTMHNRKCTYLRWCLPKGCQTELQRNTTNETKSNCNQITIEHCLEFKMEIILSREIYFPHFLQRLWNMSKSARISLKM